MKEKFLKQRREINGPVPGAGGVTRHGAIQSFSASSGRISFSSSFTTGSVAAIVGNDGRERLPGTSHVAFVKHRRRPAESAERRSKVGAGKQRQRDLAPGEAVVSQQASRLQTHRRTSGSVKSGIDGDHCSGGSIARQSRERI